MFFQECTEYYPAQTKVRDPCKESHHVLVVKTGPELQGWPTSRPRSFTAALSLKTLKWVGPATDHEVQQEFDELFGRTTELSGDVFGLASEEEVLNDINRRLALRGKPRLDSLKCSVELLMDILPPGAVQRLEQYISMSEGRRASGAPTSATRTNGPWQASPLRGRGFRAN